MSRLKVDIVAIETAYKANKLSNVAIAQAHNVSEGYIRKLAREGKWKKGEAVTPPAAKLPQVPKEVMRRSTVTSPDIPSGQLSADLIRRMLDELDTVTSHIGEIEDLIETETAGDRDGKRRAAMLKAVSLSTRVQTLKTLVAAQAELGKPAAKKGKKEEKADKALGAAEGKFRPAQPPHLVAINA